MKGYTLALLGVVGAGAALAVAQLVRLNREVDFLWDAVWSPIDLGETVGTLDASRVRMNNHLPCSIQVSPNPEWRPEWRRCSSGRLTVI